MAQALVDNCNEPLAEHLPKMKCDEAAVVTAEALKTGTITAQARYQRSLI